MRPTPVSLKRAEGRSMSASEASQFMAALQDEPLGSLFMLMLMTGIRRGEALGLRGEDVDLKQRVIAIRQQLLRIDGELKTTEVETEKSRRPST
jgi:integrase